MNKLFAALALACLPTIAAAAPSSSHRFTRDGQTYVYTSSFANHRQVIDGYSVDTGGRFHLVVRDRMVSGLANGQPVSFPVPASPNRFETAAR